MLDLLPLPHLLRLLFFHVILLQCLVSAFLLLFCESVSNTGASNPQPDCMLNISFELPILWKDNTYWLLHDKRSVSEPFQCNVFIWTENMCKTFFFQSFFCTSLKYKLLL